MHPPDTALSPTLAAGCGGQSVKRCRPFAGSSLESRRVPSPRLSLSASGTGGGRLTSQPDQVHLELVSVVSAGSLGGDVLTRDVQN